MDGELAEDGADDVGVEDVGLRSFFGEAFDGLAAALANPSLVSEARFIPLLAIWRGSKHS